MRNLLAIGVLLLFGSFGMSQELEKAYKSAQSEASAAITSAATTKTSTDANYKSCDDSYNDILTRYAAVSGAMTALDKTKAEKYLASIKNIDAIYQKSNKDAVASLTSASSLSEFGRTATTFAAGIAFYNQATKTASSSSSNFKSCGIAISAMNVTISGLDTIVSKYEECSIVNCDDCTPMPTEQDVADSIYKDALANSYATTTDFMGLTSDIETETMNLMDRYSLVACLMSEEDIALYESLSSEVSSLSSCMSLDITDIIDSLGSGDDNLDLGNMSYYMMCDPDYVSAAECYATASAYYVGAISMAGDVDALNTSIWIQLSNMDALLSSYEK